MSPGMQYKLLQDLKFIDINLNIVKNNLSPDAFQLAIAVEQLSDVLKTIVEDWYE